MPMQSKSIQVCVIFMLVCLLENLLFFFLQRLLHFGNKSGIGTLMKIEMISRRRSGSM